MSGGWAQWQEDNAVAAPEEPGRRGRSARKDVRRERARRQQEEFVRAKRSGLQSAQGVPGVVAAGAAVVFIVVLLIARSRENEPAALEAPSAAGDQPASSASTTAPVVALALDPHAGVEVLPPRSMPQPPGDPQDVDRSSPVATALGFGEQACAALTAEDAGAYRARLEPLATASLIESWQHGTAQRVHCMQHNAALDPSTPNPSDVAIVHLSAVQVYAQGGGADLSAYRWTVTVTVTVQPDGSWLVSA